MYSNKPKKTSSRTAKPLRRWADLLICLVLLGIVGLPIYLIQNGIFSQAYQVGTEISYGNFQIEVFQVNYKPGQPENNLLFCNAGLVEVEVAVKLKSVNLFADSEKISADQFTLINSKTERLYIQPTIKNKRQLAFQDEIMHVGDNNRGWLTFCPFEKPGNLQLQFLPGHPGKGVIKLKINLGEPVIVTASVL